MGIFHMLFGNDQLEMAKRERDYYKSLYEAKLRDMDAMRETLWRYKEQCDTLSAETTTLKGIINKIHEEEARDCSVVPDKELLF